MRETYKKGRAYVSCVSEKLTGETCSGCAQKDKGECRMVRAHSSTEFVGVWGRTRYIREDEIPVIRSAHRKKRVGSSVQIL